MPARVVCFLFGWLAFGLVWAADPVVSNVTVAQRAGTKLMDIGYDLAADGPVEISVRISADNGASWTVPVSNVTGAVGVGIAAGVGKVIVWDGGTDADSQHGAQLRVEITASAPDALYLVIDLSAGVSATSYPVTYLDGVPAGDWTAEYKTTKLVLRRIPKTSPSFTMGSPAGELGRETDETQHEVALTQDFYIGVFEITQKQWNLVMGDWPSYFNNTGVRDARPVEQVSYSDIRGASAGAGWPGSGAVDATSFMGRLRQRTGLVTLDLPTESQWEYACRAGTSAALSNGANLASADQDANMDLVGRYSYNGGSGSIQDCGLANGTAAAGSYLPNAWGLYDLHGNTWEWCLDYYGTYPDTVTDPPGTPSSPNRVARGGSWGSLAQHCRSAFRDSIGVPSFWRDDLGCRVASAVEPVYRVIDLSAGPTATSYPVNYLPAAPAGGWPAEYKTTKLVLRRIPKTTSAFSMGSPADEMGRGTDETQHAVTLTRDFYIGVFEVTQKQWNLVMGDWPSYFNRADVRDARPVEQVSYEDIRGASEGAGWPASSAVDSTAFMGRLRAKTGLVTLDLPTESQWEYACRAGAGTALNNGADLASDHQDDSMGLVGRYRYNGGDSYSQGVGLEGATAAVGSYLPNAWGLYDMHGNVCELCLDWYGTYPGAVSDPLGAESGSGRVRRGGGWFYYAQNCRSAYRYNTPSGRQDGIGFRVAGGAETYLVIDISAGPVATNYPVSYLAAAPSGGWTAEHKTTKLVLRRLPKTTSGFSMGSPTDELGRDANETRHEVTLSQDFYIGVFEVTQKQWNLVMADWPSYYSNNGVRDARPVEHVSYDDIRGASLGAVWPGSSAVDTASFMGNLRRKTGLGSLDLPTESQWEYACRGGTGTALNNGTNLASIGQDPNMGLVGRYSFNGGLNFVQDIGLEGATAAVGMYSPNAWGLYDLHGNVWEWCLDWYGTYPATAADPAGGISGSQRVLRGGSCDYPAQHCRSAYRVSNSPSARYTNGFRIATVAESYLVIDISDGPTATSYPIAYFDGAPASGWPTEYKTTKLVLRRIPKTAPAFTMGSPSDEAGNYSGETQHQVTLTRDFYIGVFEITQKQWERVMGTWPSYFNNSAVRDTRPVEQVRYDDIRGASTGSGWPSSSAVDAASFMGRLRQKTGLVTIDLPTESQWEYACRAGTGTALNNGTNLTNTNSDPNLHILGRDWSNGGSDYSQNCGLESGTAAVGSYLPNAWGLYDMHGNVFEWCLDWRQTYPGMITDPPGAPSGPHRVFRGGGWTGIARDCRSAARMGELPSNWNGGIGCRIARTLP